SDTLQSKLRTAAHSSSVSSRPEARTAPSGSARTAARKSPSAIHRSMSPSTSSCFMVFSPLEAPGPSGERIIPENAMPTAKTAGPNSLVNDYIAAQPPQARAVLKRVRALIRRALPRAVEGISYGIPVYKVDGRLVLYFAGFRGHYSIYPATARLRQALKPALAERLHSKGTIRFSYDERLPA